MKYLIIDAEEGGTGIRDEFGESGGWLSLQELNLPTDLSKRIERWLSDYARVRHAEHLMDKPVAQERYQQLDEEGIAILREVKSSINEETKISYYSDGFAKRIHVDG